jgi:hypothetical protein
LSLSLNFVNAADAKPRAKKNPIQRLVSAMTQSGERPAWVTFGKHRAEYKGGETFTITSTHRKRKKTIRTYRFTLNGARLIQIQGKDGRIVSYEKMPPVPNRKPGSFAPGQRGPRLAANAKSKKVAVEDGLTVKHHELPYFVRKQMQREERRAKSRKKKRAKRNSKKKR